MRSNTLTRVSNNPGAVQSDEDVKCFSVLSYIIP